jgi:hypothetical protein
VAAKGGLTVYKENDKEKKENFAETDGQNIITLPEHLSSSPVFSIVRVSRSLVLCVIFCRSLFVLLSLAIVLSVLRFTDSD